MLTNFKKSKINKYYLIIILIVAITAVFIVDNTKTKQKTNYYHQQQKAAQLMKKSINNLKEHRKELDIPINEKLDPNETGIIGKEYTSLTTTLGNLESKRTALNPDFAALMVRYFHRIGLNKGDYIGIGASGSFPGLILATLSASKTMELKPIIIYSVGASTYGANIPGFTFIEMLDYLNKKDIFPYKLHGVSLGGNLDKAEGLLTSNSKEEFIKTAKKADAPYIYNETLRESIEKRMQIYSNVSKESEIKGFVNIGGAVANFGQTNKSLSFPNGLVLNPPTIPDDKNKGLIFEYAAQGKPIIHLLNIRGLASESGITVDPVPLPEPGKSNIYYEVVYNKIILIISLLLIFTLLYIGLKKFKD